MRQFLIEKPSYERQKLWCCVVAGGPEYHQRLLASFVAQPQEGRQVGNVVGCRWLMPTIHKSSSFACDWPKRCWAPPPISISILA